MTKDMTSGSPFKKIVAFTMPLYLTNVFQQLYTIVNSIIVGQLLGTGALAAVGLTSSISFLIIGFCTGVATGFSIPIAQSFGSRDYREMRRLSGNITTLAAIISVVFTVVTSVLCNPILQWMNTPENIFADTYDYLLILFLGIPTVFVYNALAGLMRSLGDSKTPLFILLLSAILSVVLAIVFIQVFGWGVAGAGWAIFVSQLFSAVGCVVAVIKKFPLLHFRKEDLRLQSQSVSRLLSMGIPMGLQFSITGIGSVVLQSAVNQLGSVIVAAVSSGARLSNNLIGCAYDSLGSAMATYAGQNLGAGRISRLRKGVKVSIQLSLMFTVFAVFVCFVFGRPLSAMFVSGENSELIIKYTYQFVKACALFYIPLALVNILRLTIQGLGYSKLAMMAGVFEMVARVVVGKIFVPLFGFVAACVANPAAWVFANVFLIPAYFMVMKKVEKTIPESKEAEEEPLLTE